MIALVIRPDFVGTGDNVVYLVVNCEPPLKHDKTWHNAAVFNFNVDDEADVEMPFIGDQELTEMFGEKLKNNLSGPVYKVVSTILQVITTTNIFHASGRILENTFQAISGRQVVQPTDFQGGMGTSVSCSRGGNSGLLYPLEKGLIFVPTKPVFIPYQDITRIRFSGIGDDQVWSLTQQFRASSWLFFASTSPEIDNDHFRILVRLI